MHSVTNAIPTGTIASIPAKAHAHRALICAALASSPSTILLSRTSKDIDATMDSLRGLGAHIVYENKVITVTPGPAPTKGQSCSTRIRHYIAPLITSSSIHL